ncbi:MAG: glycosyltransferase family A protein [Thermoplasmata archaeon]|jgi:glycosyltransferase involved in cell wall biosynthesis
MDQSGNAASSSDRPPSIAVVVGAYTRSDYLVRAVESVLRQTLDKREIELVVTKGFENASIDEFLAERHIPAIYDREPRIGRWLLNAVERTRAPLIAILNDDDLFEPGRLAHVVSIFRDRPWLGYYRNRVQPIDAEGKTVPSEEWSRLFRDAEFDRTGPIEVLPGQKDAQVTVLRRTFAAFNASAIVVRRELLADTHAERFAQTHQDDEALFLAGILSPYGLYLDDQRLTCFRDHPGNVTREIDNLLQIVASMQRISDAYRATGHPAFAEWVNELEVKRRWELHVRSVEAAIRAGAPRRQVLHLASGYYRFVRRTPEIPRVSLRTWGIQMHALAYVFAPSAARRLLAKRTYDRTPPHLRSGPRERSPSTA